ncbi:MAG: DUF938 domain-containing protein [Sphingomonadales bacterium]|nr:DUF938 domain-containing protein [Sphingomonadales bacterium]MDE2169620.1 DUF938 domain-containing protein [Sphingomonadales bacterium]
MSIPSDIPDPRLSAPSALRNREAIAGVLRDRLPASGLVLELASGSGEHVIHFARQMPHLLWQPSDLSEKARQSIAAWTAEEGLDNILPPLTIDAAQPDWPVARADAILCINMIHISPWEATQGLMAAAGRILPLGGLLALYGPYRRDDRPIEPSNADFDADLRRRDPRWGLRRLEEVVACAEQHGLVLDRTVEMPANNLSVLFTRRAG